MKTTGDKRARDFSAARASLDDDFLSEDMPIEVVDDALREAGANPELIALAGAAAVKAALDGSRLSWREEARKKLARARQAIASLPAVARGARDELLGRLEEAQRDPRFSGQLSAAFRKRAPEEATDEELATLLEEIEALRTIASLPPDDDAT